MITFGEAVTGITRQYQEHCREDGKVNRDYFAVVDLLTINRETNQGEGE